MLSLAALWCLHFPIVGEEIVLEGLTYTHYRMIKTIAKRLITEHATQQEFREALRAKRASLLLSHKCNRFNVLQDS